MTGTAARIEALDDKQAIFVVNNLVQAVFLTSPQLSALDDDQQMALVTTFAADVAAKTDHVITDLNLDEDIPAANAGHIARRALLELATSRGGEEIVARALDTWFDRTADWGLLQGAAAIALVWLVGAADIEFTIGNAHFIKQGMSAQQQVELSAKVLHDIIEVRHFPR